MANMLYNGVELPDINTVWTDKETYTHACIIKLSSAPNDIQLFLFTSVLQAIPSETGEVRIRNIADCSRQRFSFYFDDADRGWIGGKIDDYSAGSIGLEPEIMHWTSADILLSSDNTIYFAASEPVPVGNHTYDKRSFLAGLAMGLCGKGNPISNLMYKEPVAWLYGYANDNPDTESVLSGYVHIVNGVKYAGTVGANIKTVWDKTIFPYAYAPRANYVYLCDTSMRYSSANGKLYIPAGTNYRVIFFSHLEQWLDQTAESDQTFEYHDVVWASTDIVDENGVVVRAGSAPIPVGDVAEYREETVQLPNVDTAWTDELKTQFPYAHIRRDIDSKMWYLFITTEPAYKYYPRDEIRFRAGTQYRFGGVKDNGWNIHPWNNIVTEDGATGAISTPHEITWASYDMDGYSMASNNLWVPVSIPVYE